MVFAVEPTWLEAAYATAIASTDIGLASRCVRLADAVPRVLRAFAGDAKTFVDYGAGTGLFVRLMRDRGYPFEYYDRYGPNLFARGFESSDINCGLHDVVTAFEVLEHLVHPVEDLGALCGNAQVLIATTELLPVPQPQPTDWWYYSLATGQHVTFYTEQSIDVLGRRLGLKHRATAGTLHVLSKKRIPSALLRALTSQRINGVWMGFGRRPSLLAADSREIETMLNPH